jgi:hypothetical protein
MMKEFWRQQAEWSQATFGLDNERGPVGALKHLAKEVQEAQADPTDLEEYADCLFLLFDATRRAGFTYNQLLLKAFEKLDKNRLRKWPKPSTNDEPIEHVRE